MKALILLGDAGGGHMSAAKAVSGGLKLVNPQIETSIVDLSERSHSFPFGATGPTWELVSKYRFAEAISNALYRFLNTGIGDKIASWIVFSRGSELVKRTIEEEQPDIIVSTHFIVSAVLEGLKPEFVEVATASVAADLVGFPRMLADRNAELIFCATDKAAERLRRFHIKEEVIKYPLFPVNPNLQNFQERSVVLGELGFSLDLKTILITGGGVGTVSMLAKIYEIAEIPNTQKIIICGKNQHTYESLAKKFEGRKDIVLLNFVDNIQDYYNAADLIIAKPGPATIVEIELFQRKAIFTKIVGRQEMGNIDFLKENPNFVYLDDIGGKLPDVVFEMLQKDYASFAPRFDFRSSEEIAQDLLRVT